jgi:hypothetical protein
MAIELHEYRSQQMETKQWGITQLYNKFFHEPASLHLISFLIQELCVLCPPKL